MKLRCALGFALLLGCAAPQQPRYPQVPAEKLPRGKAPPPVPFPHFPDALHVVVWRNWELVEPDCIARVVKATPGQVVDLAASMGLPERPQVCPEFLRRGYITLIRRNWHLLPYEQLLDLLGWDAGRMAYTLREDDFLWHKLGSLKPACAPVIYAAPSPEARKRAAWIKSVVDKHFGDALSKRGEMPFAFLKEFEKPPTAAPRPKDDRLRFLYSYSALYGDPLLEPELDPYPDGYLAQVAALGVNGVWLQGVLHKLAPWRLAPELSDGWQTRLRNLRDLVTRAKRHGIGVYLYLNEPRAMPPEFFAKNPDLRGVGEEGFNALCTSAPEVQEFLADAAAHLFAAVPDLAGAFTITASENLTNCWSHAQGATCVRCGPRGAAAVIAEVNAILLAGIRRSSATAKLLAWDWGWDDKWATEAIDALPQEAWLMSVSEWGLPIERGGVKSEVGEYSMSAVGPGPRAQRHWAAARKRGLKVAAKVQVNNTWELSAVPYIPVPQLVAEHMANLEKEKVDGFMLSWTLGGYPSSNLEVAAGAGVEAVARRRFGETLAPDVVKAWQHFSNAFREFPYNIGVVYRGPQHFGPANLLWRQPTGYKSTMLGFPYDDLDGWRSVYPAETFRQQFEKVGAAWSEGILLLVKARDVGASPALEAEIAVAEAAEIHFQSVANQAEYALARASDRVRAAKALRGETHDAVELFHRMNADSRIGFEATNHYYYTRLDLVEKVLNCAHLFGE